MRLDGWRQPPTSQSLPDSVSSRFSLESCWFQKNELILFCFVYFVWLFVCLFFSDTPVTCRNASSDGRIEAAPSDDETYFDVGIEWNRAIIDRKRATRNQQPIQQRIWPIPSVETIRKVWKYDQIGMKMLKTDWKTDRDLTRIHLIDDQSISSPEIGTVEEEGVRISVGNQSNHLSRNAMWNWEFERVGFFLFLKSWNPVKQMEGGRKQQPKPNNNQMKSNEKPIEVTLGNKCWNVERDAAVGLCGAFAGGKNNESSGELITQSRSRIITEPQKDGSNLFTSSASTCSH